MIKWKVVIFSLICFIFGVAVMAYGLSLMFAGLPPSSPKVVAPAPSEQARKPPRNMNVVDGALNYCGTRLGYGLVHDCALLIDEDIQACLVFMNRYPEPVDPPETKFLGLAGVNSHARYCADRARRIVLGLPLN